jgi:hypothetical protein
MAVLSYKNLRNVALTRLDEFHETKDEVFADLVGDAKNPSRLARIIANLPDPDSKNKLLWWTRTLAVIMVLFAVIGDLNLLTFLDPDIYDGSVLPVWLVICLIFISSLLFGVISYQVWRRRSGFIYTLIVYITMFSYISQVEHGENAYVIIASSICSIIEIFVFVHIRNNVFSYMQFYGAPMKRKDKTYDFRTSWKIKEDKLSKVLNTTPIPEPEPPEVVD